MKRAILGLLSLISSTNAITTPTQYLNNTAPTTGHPRYLLPALPNATFAPPLELSQEAALTPSFEAGCYQDAGLSTLPLQDYSEYTPSPLHLIGEKDALISDLETQLSLLTTQFNLLQAQSNALESQRNLSETKAIAALTTAHDAALGQSRAQIETITKQLTRCQSNLEAADEQISQLRRDAKQAQMKAQSSESLLAQERGILNQKAQELAASRNAQRLQDTRISVLGQQIESYRYQLQGLSLELLECRTPSLTEPFAHLPSESQSFAPNHLVDTFQDENAQDKGGNTTRIEDEVLQEPQRYPFAVQGSEFDEQQFPADVKGPNNSSSLLESNSSSPAEELGPVTNSSEVSPDSLLVNPSNSSLNEDLEELQPDPSAVEGSEFDEQQFPADVKGPNNSPSLLESNSSSPAEELGPVMNSFGASAEAFSVNQSNSSLNEDLEELQPDPSAVEGSEFDDQCPAEVQEPNNSPSLLESNSSSPAEELGPVMNSSEVSPEALLVNSRNSSLPASNNSSQAEEVGPVTDSSRASADAPVLNQTNSANLGAPEQKPASMLRGGAANSHSDNNSQTPPKENADHKPSSTSSSGMMSAGFTLFAAVAAHIVPNAIMNRQSNNDIQDDGQTNLDTKKEKKQIIESLNQHLIAQTNSTTSAAISTNQQASGSALLQKTQNEGIFEIMLPDQAANNVLSKKATLTILEPTAENMYVTATNIDPDHALKAEEVSKIFKTLPYDKKNTFNIVYDILKPEDLDQVAQLYQGLKTQGMNQDPSSSAEQRNFTFTFDLVFARNNSKLNSSCLGLKKIAEGMQAGTENKAIEKYLDAYLLKQSTQRHAAASTGQGTLFDGISTNFEGREQDDERSRFSAPERSSTSTPRP